MSSPDEVEARMIPFSNEPAHVADKVRAGIENVRQAAAGADVLAGGRGCFVEKP